MAELLQWFALGIGIAVAWKWAHYTHRRCDEQYDLIVTLEHSVRAHGERLAALEAMPHNQWKPNPTAPEPVEMELRYGRKSIVPERVGVVVSEPMVALKVVGPDGEDLTNG